MPTHEKRQRTRRGSAWYWKQTDCWYYTPRGAKRRASLFDEQGKRIRGKENKQAAELALARARLAGEWRPAPKAEAGEKGGGEAWLVAKVCSEYLQHCRRRAAAKAMSAGHVEDSTRYLNELCKYAGALPVAELKKGHVQFWLESHLHSVDRNPGNIRRAKAITSSFASSITFHEFDSVDWLRNRQEYIDVLYLDSMDVGVAGYEEHALAEAQAAEPKLHPGSLILLDDTVWEGGWKGKGAKAVPWLISRGWRILLAGYQVLLSR